MKLTPTASKVISAALISGSLLFTSACSSSVAPSPADTSAPSAASAPSVSADPSPAPSNAAPTTKTVSLPNGIVAKGVANDGKGDYLQTTIADTDPAMQYKPSIVEDEAKAHFSDADLAEAQKVAVKFIAEEFIDSTLNDGTDVDGWFAAHKDQIHPSNQAITLADLKTPTGTFVAREQWMIDRPDLSYVHGADTPRVSTRFITPNKIRYVEGNGLQGVWIDTQVTYSMAVTYGLQTQSTNATVSYGMAKDPADGKWKIAAYQSNVSTAEYKVK